jgi:hypothetical protein
MNDQENHSTAEDSTALADTTELTPEQVGRVIRETFDLMNNHAKQIAEDLAEFNRKRAAATERIKRNGARTSGRIV